MAKVSKKKVAVGTALGLAAAAAGAAGYFFFGSKDAAKRRAKAAAWSRKLHADVVSKAKKLKKLDEKAIRTIVDESSRAYEKVKSVDKADLAGAARELKNNWKHISAELTRVAKKDVRVVKSATKKAVSSAKKTVSKVVTKMPAKKAAKKKKA